MDDSVVVPQNVKHRIICDPATPLLDIYPRKLKSGIQTYTCNTNIHSSIIYNSQRVETTQVSINRRMDKQKWYIPAMEYYLFLSLSLCLSLLLPLPPRMCAHSCCLTLSKKNNFFKKNLRKEGRLGGSVG